MRVDLLEKIKTDYLYNSDVVMSEYLCSVDQEYHLTNEEKRHLLWYAGENLYIMVRKDGTVIERWGVIDQFLLATIIVSIISIIF